MAHLRLNSGCALVSLYAPVAVHFGVKPYEDVVYKRRDRCLVEVDGRWIWGRATDTYDCCMEYFGLGPVLLLCWVPGQFWPWRWDKD